MARYNLPELFVVELRKVLPDPNDHLPFVHLFLDSLFDSVLLKDQLQHTGVIPFWLDLAIKAFNHPEIHFKINAIGFLTDLWYIKKKNKPKLTKKT